MTSLIDYVLTSVLIRAEANPITSPFRRSRIIYVHLSKCAVIIDFKVKGKCKGHEPLKRS